MSTHRVLQCELFQTGATLRGSAGSPATTSSGLGLAMCTGGSSRKSRSGRVCCSTEVTNSSSSVKKWMVAGVAAALVMGGGGDQPATAFGWFGQPQVEKDPVEPFTLYGSILKKYMIEDVVENRVVGRRKGFTASACVNALDASKETPEMQGVPAGLKVTIIGEPSCSKGQGQTREESCTAPCTKACQAAVSRHLMEVKQETGYVLDASDIKKVTDTCSLQCFNECKLL